MSKVFSASLNKVEITYKFADGKEVGLTYRAPNTKEIDEATARGERTPTLAELRELFISRLIGDKKAIDALIAEQETSGNLYELIMAVEAALAEEKNAKGRS